MEITTQEAWTERGGPAIDIPDFVLEVIERVAFEAREDKRVDKRSGVSQRLPISVLENAVSNAERRTVALGEERVVPRVSDVYAAVPSITGKLELEYEGELQGGDTIARDLIRRAAGRVLEDRMGGADLGKIVAWFDQGGALKVSGDQRSDLCIQGFSVVPGLIELVSEFGLANNKDVPRQVAACELVLEGLAAQKRISRSEELGYTRAKPERREPGYGKGGISFG
jgi:magnesium chelatase subunit I